MKTLVILPTYNESENLPRFIPEVFTYVPESADILVIDDNSPDGTGKMADEMAKSNPRISVLHRAGKMGLGSAYLTGFQYALKQNYEAIVQMDSDFSHSPKAIPSLIKALDDSDFVIGSRYLAGGGIQGWPLHRLWLSKFANFYSHTILNIGIYDLTGGFRCFRRKVIESIDLKSILSEGYAFQIEFNYKVFSKRFRIKEVPITFADRTRGKSKLSFGVIWEAIFIVWKLRFL